MRSLVKNIGCALAMLFVAGSLTPPAAADEAPPPCAGKILEDPAPEPGPINSVGLLWRIEKPGLAPSYLFGTIHSTDDGAVALARKAAQNIPGAKIVATEIGGPFDAYGMGEIASALMVKAIDKEEDTFAAFHSPADVALAESFVRAHGLASELAHHLRLWFLGVGLTQPLCEIQRVAKGLPEVDNLIAQIGKDAGVKIIGLETFDEQASVIASVKTDTAAEVLLTSARHPELNDDSYVTLLAKYRDGNPASFFSLADHISNLTAQERAAQNDFIATLMGGRNATMAERSRPLLTQGGAFIAVGAFHLVGAEGLIERFRAFGYSVVKVW